METSAGVLCGRCGRVLRTLLSRARGYGPRCFQRTLLAARVLQESPHPSAKKAGDALARGAYRRVAGQPGLFLVPSATREGVTWTLDCYACPCEGGRNSLLCWHRVGVIVLSN